VWWRLVAQHLRNEVDLLFLKAILKASATLHQFLSADGKLTPRWRSI